MIILITVLACLWVFTGWCFWIYELFLSPRSYLSTDATDFLILPVFLLLGPFIVLVYLISGW